jgi:mannosyl-oligosaccharide alpha-1,2-mannosidase
LEFGDLSRLTGDRKYVDASLKAYEAAIAKRSSLDLLGTSFDVEKGEYVGNEDVAPDEPADSFYEYLWGGWQMLQIESCRAWWETLTKAMLAYKLTHVDGRLWFKTVDFRTGLPTGDASVTELASFYAELVAKGGYRAVGEAFYDSWTSVLGRYELIPEVIFYPDLSIVDPRYWLRPEYPNAAFDLWFLTHDEKYRRTAYRYFRALREHCRVSDGYTVLTDVRTRPMHLYLTFADSPRFDPARYYLNTEGKIMRGLRT